MVGDWRGGKSIHIDIRFFLINDVLKREKIELVHYPSERMMAHHYIKSLQGSLFRKMMDVLMGLAPFLDKERAKLGEIVN